MSTAIKIKAPSEDKYKEMTTVELREELIKRDTKVLNEKVQGVLSDFRAVRMGTMSGLSLLLGLIYQARPDMEDIYGTGASLGHFAAIGGTLGAFLAEDEVTAQAAEGVGNAGLVPFFTSAGRMIGGLIFK